MAYYLPIFVSTLALSSLLLPGCAHVPQQLQTAIAQQSAELKTISDAEQKSLDALFAEIHLLQTTMLSNLESTYLSKYALGPKAVTLDDKSPAVIYTDPKTGKGLPASGNTVVDVIGVSTTEIITKWFTQKRADNEENLQKAKAEFAKIQDHIKIAQEINDALRDYIDSLVNLNAKEKQLGTHLITRLNAVPGISAIQDTVLRTLSIDTSDLDKQLPK